MSGHPPTKIEGETLMCQCPGAWNKKWMFLFHGALSVQLQVHHHHSSCLAIYDIIDTVYVTFVYDLALRPLCYFSTIRVQKNHSQLRTFSRSHLSHKSELRFT